MKLEEYENSTIEYKSLKKVKYLKYRVEWMI